MEILHKQIKDEKDSFTKFTHIPETFLEKVGIQYGDIVRVKASSKGIFCIEKSPDDIGMKITKLRGLVIPERMREKYRITKDHKAMFFIHNGLLCFKFTREQ